MATDGTRRWNDGGAYEGYVGRWSRLVAREFLPWLDVPNHADWLDVGCGTGALTQTILAMASPASVRGIDLSPDFIEFARMHTADPRASFAVGDAQALPEPDAVADVAVSGLALNFVPQPEKAASELARVVHPGGRIGIYVWDYSGSMHLMRYFWDAAVALDPAARPLDEGSRFPLCAPDPLSQLFTGAGLQHVETRAIDVPTAFRDFDDYWTPFLGGQGPASVYVMSLDGQRRTQLRESLRSRLPIADDGAIPLTARAWAVKGRR
ncbi:MAG TPA: class I SAM-dependent methyltransferase [Ktedonobacterales bacterium]|jgi:SAM-dependent methyltransferase|nr:class I SAM-dependent methyltransferase [Ktedonobacterales bacterium]